MGVTAHVGNEQGLEEVFVMSGGDALVTSDVRRKRGEVDAGPVNFVMFAAALTSFSAVSWRDSNDPLVPKIRKRYRCGSRQRSVWR
jgi:hypothetical protein